MKKCAGVGLLLFLAATTTAAPAPDVTEGFVTAESGVELYYVKTGRGAQTVILPARLFTFDDLRWLAERYTLISYDMRNRGRSSRVADLAKISMQADVADLEAIRRHFGVDQVHLIGYSYLGLMVMLYALENPAACRAHRAARPGCAEIRHGVSRRVRGGRSAAGDRSTRRRPAARAPREATITRRIPANIAKKSGASCASCSSAIRSAWIGSGLVCASRPTSGR